MGGFRTLQPTVGNNLASRFALLCQANPAQHVSHARAWLIEPERPSDAPGSDLRAEAHHGGEGGPATHLVPEPYLATGKLRKDARCIGAARGGAINPDHRGIVLPVTPMRGANPK